jgi:hypothetical protein
MCYLASTILYRHMVSITPRLATMFLVNHTEVDTDCTVSFEDVIKHFTEKNRNVSITCGRDFGMKVGSSQGLWSWIIAILIRAAAGKPFIGGIAIW